MTINSKTQRNASIWWASIGYPGCKPVYFIAAWSRPVLEGAIKRFIEDGWRTDELRPIVVDGPTLDTAERVRDKIKSFQQDGEHGSVIVSMSQLSRFDNWLELGDKYTSFLFC
jgi:hypothetical protein